MNGNERKKYFESWAQKLAREKRANGVTILVCRNPTNLHVNVAKDAEPVFDKAAADRLTEMLIGKFRERKYDEGLLTAVKMVADKLAEQKLAEQKP